MRAATAVAEDGSLPLLGAAFAAGAVSRAHVEVAARALQGIPKRLLRAVDEAGVSGAARVDAFLAEHCRRLAPDDVRVLVPHLLDVLDPGGRDRFDPDAFERRELRLHPDSTGMVVGSFQLDPEGGATVAAAVDHFGAPLPVRQGVDEHGAPVDLRDVRTKAQRQADALVAICAAALARARSTGDDGESQPAGGGRAPAQVTVVATAEQLAALDGGPAAGLATCDQLGPIPAPVLARLSCDGMLRRVLLAPSGAVLDVGRAVRCATPAQRKALAVRDGTCVVPGCRVPVSRCDIHHVISWAHGGLTDLANLAPLCGRHHSAVHAGVWQLQRRGDLPWVVPPSWVDPRRRLLRNQLPAAVQTALALGRDLIAAEEDGAGISAQQPQPP